MNSTSKGTSLVGVHGLVMKRQGRIKRFIGQYHPVKTLSIFLKSSKIHDSMLIRRGIEYANYWESFVKS